MGSHRDTDGTKNHNTYFNIYSITRELHALDLLLRVLTGQIEVGFLTVRDSHKGLVVLSRPPSYCFEGTEYGGRMAVKAL